MLYKKLNENNFYFIAEIGQNHQGSLSTAKKMVDEIKTISGISAIKTTKRNLDVCLTEKIKNMPYENPNSFGKTYYEHRKNLELSDEDFIELKNYIEFNGFDFISSFTDISSLDFLINIGVKIFKIASQRAVDTKLLEATAKTNATIILSTGMCCIDDVDKAVDVLKNNELYILQSTSSYPCSEYDLNLNVIKLYLERYSNLIKGVGFSGHHTGIAPDIAAYVLGARIFERHFTLDRAMKGTDHAASLELRGLDIITKYLKQVRNSLGSNEKKVLPCEKNSILKLRSDLI